MNRSRLSFLLAFALFAAIGCSGSPAPATTQGKLEDGYGKSVDPYSKKTLPK